MKKTCSKCYQKFEEEDMVLNKSDAYSFCVECHKEYKEEEANKNDERNKKQDKENKKLEEVKHPLLKALFPYFLSTLVIGTILIVAYWIKKIQATGGHCIDCRC